MIIRDELIMNDRQTPSIDVEGMKGEDSSTSMSNHHLRENMPL